MSNSLKFLGLCKKAGKLEIGEESVGISARAKKARIILAASDSADNSKRRAQNFARTGNIPFITLPYGKFDLGNEVGRGSPGLMAITDIGLAASFIDKLSVEFPEKYDDIKSVLGAKAEKAMQRKKEAKAHERNLKMGKRRTK